MKWASHKHSNVYSGVTVIASEFRLMHMKSPPNLELRDFFGNPFTSTLFQKKTALNLSEHAGQKSCQRVLWW